MVLGCSGEGPAAESAENAPRSSAEQTTLPATTTSCEVCINTKMDITSHCTEDIRPGVRCRLSVNSAAGSCTDQNLISSHKLLSDAKEVRGMAAADAAY